MTSYGERRWGKPPPGYVPGLGRGAVGFVTRLDIGPARNIIFNPQVIINLILYNIALNQKNHQMGQRLIIYMDMKKNYLIKMMKMKKIVKQINNMKILINTWKKEGKI